MNSNYIQNIFINGKTIYLRQPNLQKDVIEGCWHNWFNDPEITKFLIHGIFPISREEETEYVRKQLNDPSSLVLSIIEKESNEHIGIVSLKSIDLINRNAEIVIIMGPKKVLGAALEAMILMTSHAFEKLNLIKLYAGQHEGLWKWVNALEMIGYKIEGYRRKGGMKDGEYDIVLTGITDDDYYSLKDRNLLNINNIKELYNNRRKENIFPKIKDFFNNL